MSYDKHIIGLRAHKFSGLPLQIIFSDGDKSSFDQSSLPANTKDLFWLEKRIPQGETIAQVEMLYKIANSNLEGVRFKNAKDKLLVVVGWDQNTSWHMDSEYELPEKVIKTHKITKFEVPEGHRLLGTRSATRNNKQARHYDFSFYIGHLDL